MKDKEEIKKNITEQLFWDSRVDSSKITVEFDGDTVVLSGTVINFSSKGIIESDTWLVNGVHAVKNNIKVKYPEIIKLPTDKDIKQKILANLEWNTSINPKELKISVDKGIVSLEGSVNHLWKKNLVEDLVGYNLGVIDVENKITIVPTDDNVDETIAKDIINAVERSMDFDINQLDIKVKNGKVKLMGTVNNSTQYFEVENIAEYTVGVRDIENNLAIKIE